MMSVNVDGLLTVIQAAALEQKRTGNQGSLLFSLTAAIDRSNIIQSRSFMLLQAGLWDALLYQRW